MPHGKPAGVRCVQLTADNRCALFGRPDRPAVCLSLKPAEDMCGDSREQALRWLGVLETETRPDSNRANSRSASPAFEVHLQG